LIDGDVNLLDNDLASPPRNNALAELSNNKMQSNNRGSFSVNNFEQLPNNLGMGNPQLGIFDAGMGSGINPVGLGCSSTAL